MKNRVSHALLATSALDTDQPRTEREAGGRRADVFTEAEVVAPCTHELRWPSMIRSRPLTLIAALTLGVVATGCADPEGCAELTGELGANGTGCVLPPSPVGPTNPGGNAWQLDYDGAEGSDVLSGTGGYVVRNGDRVTLSLSAADSDGGLVIGFDDAPLGTAGTNVTTSDISWYHTLEGIDCPRGMPVATLTVNDEEHVAGTFSGTSICDDPSNATFEISGTFDYRGPITVD